MDLLLTQVRYVIDTSSLIDLDKWFPREVVPGAWDLIEELGAQRVLVSVEEVKEELERQHDELYEWASERTEMFLPLSEDLQLATRKVLSTHPTLVDYRRRRSSADPFVIGAAELLDASVVAEENPSGAGGRPKIPNVCHDRGVSCLRLVQMFNHEGLKLIRDGSS